MRRVLFISPILLMLLLVDGLFAQSPTISGISPTTAVAWQTQVTITGTNFGASGGYVQFGNVILYMNSITSWSNTQIVSWVPNPPAGQVAVSVFNAAGVQSNSVNITVVYPTITNFSPTTAVAGESVTITGTNFGTTAGYVQFGNINQYGISSWSNTQIVAAVPWDVPAGTVAVSVANSAGAQGSSMNLTVAYPTITGFSPSLAVAGQLLTITGTNFGSTTGELYVAFGSIDQYAISSWTNTQIVVSVPPDTPAGTVPVFVVNSGGAQSSPQDLTFVYPSITSFSPSPAVAGQSVTITGTNFGTTAGYGYVQFGDADQYGITSWSNTQIVTSVPPDTPSGSIAVSVVNSGDAPSIPMSLTVGPPPPSITSLSPYYGSVGTVVTISGANFGSSQGSSTVTFNGVAGTPTSWDNTSITVAVPSGAASGNVVVTVSGTASYGVFFPVPMVGGQTSLSDSMSDPPTTYGYQNVGGRNFMTLISGSGCASCGGRGNTELTYDLLGNTLSSTDALGNTTLYTYDSMGNVLTRTQYLTPSTPLTWGYTYNGFQEVLTATDPLGNVTQNYYDTNGNLTSTVTPPPNGSGSGLTTGFQYNSLGELTQVTDPNGNPTTLTYYPSGLVETITDAQHNTTTFTYDGRGNRLTSTDALQNITQYSYDSMNHLTAITPVTSPATPSTQFLYDNRGRRYEVIDADGNPTTYGYDNADRLTSVLDAAKNLTMYSYDTENNMVAITTDAGTEETQFFYDAFGRVKQVTFPSTHSEGYTYDAMNNLLAKTDRKGQPIQYSYDALYRLTRKTYPDQTAVNYTYDPLSRLTQVTDPTGTYSFTYDNLGRLLGTGTQYSFLSTALTSSYGYDAASNRVSLASSESGITNYSYDSLNRLASLTDDNTGQFGFGYDVLGRRTSLTRPNGVNTSYTYDTLSRLLSVLHNGGALPGSTSYLYDAAGNRTSKTAVQEASPNPVSVLSQYSYDSIYELTQAVVNSSVAEGYSYDAVGNRLTSAGPTTYNYNLSNELTSTSAATYTHDNNGNTTSSTNSTGTTSYTWDFENRLTSVTLPGTGGTVNFKYDPFGRRIEKIAPTSGTTIYAYDGDNITEELGGGGSLLAHYTQGAGIDEPLAMTGTGGTYFYHADGLGSITSLTDTTGNVAASYVYDSFGKLTALSGTITNPFQYTGREFDAETGLYYYRARYYDTTAGRFLGEDPIRFTGGSNFYGYTRNNPINFADPQGLCPSDNKVPCLPNVRDFVNAHLAAAQILASELPNGTTVQEILATAGNESSYGASPLGGGNYFGLHGSGYVGQIDTYWIHPKLGKPFPTPVFPSFNGFLLSGHVFVDTEKQYLAKVDASNPTTFFQTIHAHGYGADPGYVDYMMRNESNMHGPYLLVGACLPGVK